MGRYVATLPPDEQPTVVLSSPYERAAATAAHVPVPLAGVHLIVIAGAARKVTVAVAVAGPAEAVTFVSAEVVRVVVA